MRAKLCMTAALVLLLAGCGWKGSGTIVEKTHDDAYSYTTLTCTAFSTNGGCTAWTPITNWVPETWGYKVKDAAGEIHEVSADKEEWEKRNIGDPFNNQTTDPKP